jgi:hypothetical protein
MHSNSMSIVGGGKAKLRVIVVALPRCGTAGGGAKDRLFRTNMVYAQ